MPLAQYASGTATISTTETSLTTNTAGPDVDTTDGTFWAVLDLNAVAAGDVFEFQAYETTVSGGTQRLVASFVFAGAQGTPIWVSPPLPMLWGWDFTIKKVSGTDRSITWSVRYYA